MLAGRPGSWDSRGARVAAVLDTDPLTVLYDGRASAEQNWYERTGLARSTRRVGLVAVGDEPVAGSPGPTARCATPPPCRCPDGSCRLYYEAARPDGGHDLRTELVEAPAEPAAARPPA